MVALQMGVLLSAVSEQDNQKNRILKLIAYATNSSGGNLQRFEIFQESQERLHKDFNSAKRFIVATWFVQGEQNPQYEKVLECSQQVSLTTASKAIDAIQYFNISSRLKDITVQSLIVGAELDRTYPPKNLYQLQREFSQVDFYLIKGSSHNAHIEKPDEFNKVVIQFVQG